MASLFTDVLSKLTWVHGGIAFLGYLVLVRALRYRRRDAMAKKFNFPNRAAMAKMTVEEAHAITEYLSELEFPYIWAMAGFFGFFYTYGIPTISKLLCQTGQLSTKENASKRVADTGAVMSEALSKPGSNRNIEGMARLNYLHDIYRNAGKIDDRDMLFTLGLSVVQPNRWLARFDWRTLTEMEKCALGVYYRDMGDAMKIPYDVLKPYLEGKPDDGIAFYEAIEAWSDDYAKEYMVPSEYNKQTADRTLDVLLFGTPEWRMPFMRGIMSTLIDDRLRTAIMLEEPTPFQRSFVNAFGAVRRFVLRHLMLPRPGWSPAQFITAEDKPDEETGKYHALHWNDLPWYVKPTFWNRWGPGALWARLTGGVVPGDPAYLPGGYLHSELGPKKLSGKGVAEMEKNRQELRDKLMRRRAAGGCPVPMR